MRRSKRTSPSESTEQFTVVGPDRTMFASSCALMRRRLIAVVKYREKSCHDVHEEYILCTETSSMGLSLSPSECVDCSDGRSSAFWIIFKPLMRNGRCHPASMESIDRATSWGKERVLMMERAAWSPF